MVPAKVLLPTTHLFLLYSLLIHCLYRESMFVMDLFARIVALVAGMDAKHMSALMNLLDQ